MAWDSWKVGTFASLQTDDMGYQAQVMLKKLNKIAREVKVSHKAGISPSLGNGVLISFTKKNFPPLPSGYISPAIDRINVAGYSAKMCACINDA